MQYFQQPTTMFEGFGMNPAYATPAYMSNFRPAYAENDTSDNAYARDFRYSDAIKESLFLKNSDINYGSDPAQYMSARHKAIWDSHSDALVNGLTYVGIPLASWYASNKLFRMSSTLKTSSMFANPAAAAWKEMSIKAAAAARGTSAAASARAVAGATINQSLGNTAGTAIGRGFGSALGGAMNMGARALGFGGIAGATGALGALGGTVGGLLGTVGLPLLIGAGISSAANEFISDPYVAIRRGSDAWLANTANTYVGGGAQPKYGGFGISHSYANHLSKSLVNSASHDRSFDRQSYNIMADYGMQEGLFNEIGNLNVQDVTKRVERMADSVKALMAITNNPSMKDAVKLLGRVKAMGVTDPIDAANIIRKIGHAGALSGTSVNQIMDTVGNQGQYFYQQAGMLPVLGQTTAAALYGGFANAAKRGLVSNATMSALGGLEGMTQSAMETNVSMLNNPMWRMALHSGQGGEMGNRDIRQMLSQAGQKFHASPLRYLGESALNLNVEQSEIAAEGNISLLTKFKDTMRKSGAMNLVKFKGNKADWVETMGFMTTQGFSREQIRALNEQVRTSADPRYVARAKEVLKAQYEKEAQQLSSQDGRFDTQGIPYIGALDTHLQNWNKGLDRMGNSIGGVFAGISASISDAMGSVNAYSAGINPQTLRELTTIRTDGSGKQFLDTSDFKFLEKRTTRGDSGGSVQYTAEVNRLTPLKAGIKNILMNSPKDGEEYKTVVTLMDKLRSGKSEGVPAIIDKLQKLTNNGFLTGRRGESAEETKRRVLKDLDGVTLKESHKSVSIDKINEDSSNRIFDNLNQEGWVSRMFEDTPLSGLLSSARTDDDAFMRNGGEMKVLQSVIDSAASGESTDGYFGLLSNNLNSDSTNSLMSKDYKSLTDDEKKKVDTRKALLIKSGLSKDKQNRLNDLASRRDSLNIKEGTEFSNLTDEAVSGFNSNIDDAFSDGVYDRNLINRTLQVMGKSVDGVTAFSSMNDKAFQNAVGINTDRNAAIRQYSQKFGSMQSSVGQIEKERSLINEHFTGTSSNENAIRDFSEVIKRQSAINEDYAKQASGLSEHTAKLANVIGTSEGNRSLSENISDLTKQVEQLGGRGNSGLNQNMWPGKPLETGGLYGSR